MKTISTKRGWWFSNDEKRGFAWSEVKGFKYHDANSLGSGCQSTIYVYLGGGIVHLSGSEADQVYQQLTDVKKKVAKEEN